MISSISNLFAYNYSLVCSFFAWGCAQFLKILFTYVNKRKLNFKLLFSSGGMPSAHSAAVAALTTSIGVECGVNSPMFSIAAIFAAVVMYDSSGVRRSSGEQAKLLNRIVRILSIEKIKKPKFKKKQQILNEPSENDEVKFLKEHLGHTTIEVFVGALIGVLIVLTVPF